MLLSLKRTVLVIVASGFSLICHAQEPAKKEETTLSKITDQVFTTIKSEGPALAVLGLLFYLGTCANLPTTRDKNDNIISSMPTSFMEKLCHELGKAIITPWAWGEKNKLIIPPALAGWALVRFGPDKAINKFHDFMRFLNMKYGILNPAINIPAETPAPTTPAWAKDILAQQSEIKRELAEMQKRMNGTNIPENAVEIKAA